MERILTKLYHIDLGIEDNSRNIVKKNKELGALRKEQKVHDEEVEVSRAQQAKARATVMQKEKNIKRAEKALEGKVFRLITPESSSLHEFLVRNPNSSRPRLKSSMQPER